MVPESSQLLCPHHTVNDSHYDDDRNHSTLSRGNAKENGELDGQYALTVTQYLFDVVVLGYRPRLEDKVAEVFYDTITHYMDYALTFGEPSASLFYLNATDMFMMFGTLIGLFHLTTESTG